MRGWRVWAAALLMIAGIHAGMYAWMIPLWQAPDEPLLYEYAALTSRLGRIPDVNERDLALEQALLQSLWEHSFWRYTTGQMPPAAPQRLAEAEQLFFMPRQVGGDPPLYFLAAGGVLRLLAGWPLDAQAYALRALNVLLLPGLVLVTLLIAREVVGRLPEGRIIAYAAASLVALNPMLAAVTGAVGNDPLANLIGALLTWRWLVALRQGVDRRRVIELALLVLVGLLTKRTLMVFAVVLAAAGLIWMLRHQRRRVVVATAALLLLAGSWLEGQIDPSTTWGWYWYGSHQQVARVWPNDGSNPALQVRAGELIVYPLAPTMVDQVRGGVFRFGMRVWDADHQAAIGRLVVFTDQQRHEVRFRAQPAGDQVEISASVFPQTRGVLLGIEVDRGTIYADDLWAEGQGVQLLANGGLNTPGLRSDGPLQDLLNYTRLNELFWALAGGQLWHQLPASWASVLFASFWGHFGWMDIPFVLGSAWFGILLAGCVVGSVAAGRLLLIRPASQIDRLWVVALLGSVAITIVAVNSLILPQNQSLAQGRYLFPILPALAVVWASGAHSLVVWGRRQWVLGWLLIWLGGLACLAGQAWLKLLSHYAG
ncbi:MAG: hypothetical protein Fur005_33670 [Roseiflexaceae bacterium]